MATPTPPTYPADKPQIWNPTADFPDNPDLIIVFHGLFSFCYVAEGDQQKLTSLPRPPYCEIGVFNHSPCHELHIDIEGGSCTGGSRSYRYTFDDLARHFNDRFILEVTDAQPDVAFYQVGELFNRQTSTVDQDFRWDIDLEGPDLYDDLTEDKRPFYDPKLLVRNGTFYTSEKTQSVFKWVNQRDYSVRPLGQIAYCLAARITLEDGQEATFTFKDPMGARQTCTFGRSHPPAKIFFTNLCYISPGSPTPAQVNDFSDHFITFDPPAGSDVFDLVLDSGGPHSHDCEGLRAVFVESKRSPDSSDDAPCKSSGYGRTSGTP